MAPPHMRRAAPALAGSGPLKSDRRGSTIDSIDKPSIIAAQAIVDATERAEDLLALWREQRRLSDRVRLARIKFELIGLDPDEQDVLADEVAQWGRLVKAFAAGQMVEVEHEERQAA